MLSAPALEIVVRRLVAGVEPVSCQLVELHGSEVNRFLAGCSPFYNWGRPNAFEFVPPCAIGVEDTSGKLAVPAFVIFSLCNVVCVGVKVRHAILIRVLNFAETVSNLILASRISLVGVMDERKELEPRPNCGLYCRR